MPTAQDHACSKFSDHDLQEDEEILIFVIPTQWYRSRNFVQQNGLCLERMVATYWENINERPDSHEFHFALAIDGFMTHLIRYLKAHTSYGVHVWDQLISYCSEQVVNKNTEGPYLPKGVVSLFFISCPDQAGIEVRAIVKSCEIKFFFNH